MDTAIVIGGGQAGLGTAFALRNQGFRPVILEAGAEPVGSWPRYYDSLTTFTPARISALPGMPFPGTPQHFPVRDQVVGYLRRYAARLDCEIRTGQRVSSVVADREGYRVQTEDEAVERARVVVAASGSFDNPHRPDLPGLDTFEGKVLHSCEYRSPGAFAGQRIVVVGSGSSALQIACELAGHASTTLASRRPPKVTDHWLPESELLWKGTEVVCRLPLGPLVPYGRLASIVPDVTGALREALAKGEPDRRELFTGASGSELRWPDGSAEHVDTVILATGYRPALEYLRPLGALDRVGVARQRFGLSTTHPGLAFMGIEGQHTFFSNAIHGVGHDARLIARRLRQQVARAEPAWLPAVA